MGRLLWLLLAFVLTLAACSNTSSTDGENLSGASATPTRAAALEREQGYLANNSQRILYVRIDEVRDGQISGSWLQTDAPSDVAAEIRSQEVPFSGSLSDDDVVILVAGERFSGELSGETLTLNWTDADGFIRTVELREATANEHNEAVAHLRTTADEARARAIDEQAAKLAGQATADEVAACASATLGLAEANMVVAFDGPQRQRDCAAFAASSAESYQGRPSSTTLAEPFYKVCEGTYLASSVVVWDTGVAIYGSNVCRVLGFQ
ncbi:MAG: hypothetical protein R3C29_03960 [Dehalococcoidia bacterium]